MHAFFGGASGGDRVISVYADSSLELSHFCGKVQTKKDELDSRSCFKL
jgi:hypothetical protein